MRQLIAGNWKMNGTSASLAEIEAVCGNLAQKPASCDVMICPPATLIAQAVSRAKGRVAIGGQDCHAEPSGAFTGDISAEMLKDAGASAVIVGHSERRQYHAETSEIVAAKAKAAWRAGLLAIICIGETEAQRVADQHLGICQDQLAVSVPEGATAQTTVIAYEPVWAIGTGRTATNKDIVDMHAHIRRCLVSRFQDEGHRMRILYGGSVKASNASDILMQPEVGGALVGGASLRAADFAPIFFAARPLS